MASLDQQQQLDLRQLQQLCELETAVEVLHELIDTGVDLKGMLAVGKEPMLFACSLYEETLAIKLLTVAHGVCVNVCDDFGHTPLHYAVSGSMPELARALVSNKRTRAQLYRRNLDFPLQFGLVEPGGRTALHIAVVENQLEMIPILYDAHDIVDFDGNTPVQLALLYDRPEAVRTLGECSNALVLEKTKENEATKRKVITQQMSAAKQRYAASQIVSSQFESIQTWQSIWTIEECDRITKAVLEYADTHGGWQTKRHAGFPTTDLPSFKIVRIDRWVRDTLETRVFPKIQQHYGIDNRRLGFRDLFFVKYHENQQRGLNLHRDGSVLSFNVLLNSTEDFEGGGTYFQHLDKHFTIQQGDVLVHSGKWQHSGVSITRGIRLILVAFLNVLPEESR